MRELSIIELDMVSGSANTAAGAALDGRAFRKLCQVN